MNFTRKAPDPPHKEDEMDKTFTFSVSPRNPDRMDDQFEITAPGYVIYALERHIKEIRAQERQRLEELVIRTLRQP